jgi:hypothetical protein
MQSPTSRLGSQQAQAGWPAASGGNNRRCCRHRASRPQGRRSGSTLGAAACGTHRATQQAAVHYSAARACNPPACPALCSLLAARLPPACSDDDVVKPSIVGGYDAPRNRWAEIEVSHLHSRPSNVQPATVRRQAASLAWAFQHPPQQWAPARARYLAAGIPGWSPCGPTTAGATGTSAWVRAAGCACSRQHSQAAAALPALTPSLAARPCPHSSLPLPCA